METNTTDFPISTTSQRFRLHNDEVYLAILRNRHITINFKFRYFQKVAEHLTPDFQLNNIEYIEQLSCAKNKKFRTSAS